MQEYRSRESMQEDRVGNSIEGIRRSTYSMSESVGMLSLLCAGIFLAGARSCYHQGKIAESLNRMNMQDNPVSQTRDVIGNELEDRFYTIDGDRVYVEIDEKPIESYFEQKMVPGGIR